MRLYVTWNRMLCKLLNILQDAAVAVGKYYSSSVQCL